MQSDTEKIKTAKAEANANQKFCDDRYVMRSWIITSIGILIMLAASLSWGFSRWGAKVDNALNDYYEFKTTCEVELRLFRNTAIEGNTKLDTMITLMRDIKKHGL
jgi:hypothetical protein